MVCNRVALSAGFIVPAYGGTQTLHQPAAYEVLRWAVVPECGEKRAESKAGVCHASRACAAYTFSPCVYGFPGSGVQMYHVVVICQIDGPEVVGERREASRNLWQSGCVLSTYCLPSREWTLRHELDIVHFRRW